MMRIRLRDGDGTVVQVDFDPLPTRHGERAPNSGVAEVRRDGAFVGFAKWERLDRDLGYEIIGRELGKL
jgi:hypothetical protein